MADVRPGPFREGVDVVVDTSSVGPYLEGRTGAIRAALAGKVNYWSLRLQQIIVNEKLQGQLLRHVSGKLGDSVRAMETKLTPEEISGGVTAGGGPVPARPLEYGSAAHEIVPVNAHALHFYVDQKEIFTQHVNHPGTKAYAFMRGTLDEHAEEIRNDMQEAIGY